MVRTENININGANFNHFHIIHLFVPVAVDPKLFRQLKICENWHKLN